MIKELKRDYKITYNIYNTNKIYIYLFFYSIQFNKNKNSRIKASYVWEPCNLVIKQSVISKRLTISQT